MVTTFLEWPESRERNPHGYRIPSAGPHNLRHIDETTSVDGQTVPLAFGFQPPASSAAAVATPLQAGGASVGSVVSAYPFARASRSGDVSRVYAIFRVALTQRYSLKQVSLLTPGGQTVTEAYLHSFENGYLHFSRQDGAQWPHGDYTLTLDMQKDDGTSVTASALVHLNALSLPLPELPLGSAIRGMNGNPVTLK